MQHLRASYDGTASSVPTARHDVERTLASWGLDELCWTAALLVSELAANVALHARTPFTVSLRRLTPDVVRLEVTDGSPRVPRQRHFGDEATTGRGLHLVQDLSRAWGVETGVGGKTVWVELAGGAGGAGRDDQQDRGEADLDALLSAFPDLDDDARGTPTARAA